MILNRKPIESRQNPNFRRWRDCLKTSGIREFGECLVMGEKIVREVLARHGDYTRALLVPHRFPEIDLREVLASRWNQSTHGEPIENSFRTVAGLTNPFSEKGALQHAHRRPFQVYELTDSLFEVLDEAGTHGPILVLEPPPLLSAELGPIRGLEVVLQLQDPTNLGAAIRSAQAFGAREVILLEGCAHPWIPKSIRSSAGASLASNISTVKGGDRIFETSKETGSIGLDMNGHSLHQFQWPRHCRIFLGEEGRGLSKLFRGQRVSIPIQAGIESLNATTALAIALYDRGLKVTGVGV